MQSKLTKDRSITMLNFLPCFFIYIISNTLFILNTIFWGGLLSIGGVIKLFLPCKGVRVLLTRGMDKLMYGWATINGLILKLIANIDWDVEGLENLCPKHWYLLISNHLSGLDIAVTAYILRNHIPMLKFFLKKELIYVPFLGLACWALDMPFMNRSSPAKLRKNPKLKGKDLQATKKSCQKFKYLPTSIINYVEGSRYTEEKCQRQNSPYRYLLKPKAGGIAFTLASMGNLFTNLLNITIVYPNAPKNILNAAMKGKIDKIVVRIEAFPVPVVDDQRYLTDPEHRIEFQRWLNQLWHEKDQQIHQILTTSQTASNNKQKFYQITS